MIESWRKAPRRRDSPTTAGISQVERKGMLTSGENSKARRRDTVAGGVNAAVRDAKALWLPG